MMISITRYINSLSYDELPNIVVDRYSIQWTLWNTRASQSLVLSKRDRCQKLHPEFLPLFISSRYVNIYYHCLFVFSLIMFLLFCLSLIIAVQCSRTSSKNIYQVRWDEHITPFFETTLAENTSQASIFYRQLDIFHLTFE